MSASSIVRPLVMDGGMGTTLKQLNAFESEREYQTLWSAAPLVRGNHAPVLAAHEAFIRAGADIISTNTYACTHEILSKARVEHQQEDLLHDACRLAVAATQGPTAANAAMVGRHITIAGAVPPLGVSYRADLVKGQDEMRNEYLTFAGVLAQYCDVLLCETMSSIEEARAAAEACRFFNKPVWVAVVVGKHDESNPDRVTVRSGEPIEDFVRALAPLADALIVNCSTPENTEVAIKMMNAELARGKPNRRSITLGAYPNRMEPVSEDWVLDTKTEGGGLLRRRADVTPKTFADCAVNLVRAGCSMVGGCCGIAPDDISQVAFAFRGIAQQNTPRRGSSGSTPRAPRVPFVPATPNYRTPGAFAAKVAGVHGSSGGCECLTCHESAAPRATAKL